MEQASGISEGRLRHMLGVARTMYRQAREAGKSEGEARQWFLLGLVHDIGYEFAEPERHGLVGAEILSGSGFSLWREVKYHADPRSPYRSEALDALNRADFLTDVDGTPGTSEERLQGIAARYGAFSPQYRNALLLAQHLNFDDAD